MKNFLFYLFSFLTIASFASCSSDDVEQANVDMDISASIISIPQQGGESTFTINCSAPWEITSDNDWCSVSPKSHNGGGSVQVTVTVPVNNTGADRENTLYVVSKGNGYVVKVEQSYSLIVDQTAFTAKPEGETIVVKLKTSGGHTITPNVDWIAHAKSTRLTDASESFTISPNVTGSKRTGTVTFSLKGTQFDITIDQEAFNVPAPDPSGMNSDAKTLASKIIIGWNLGNSLEASGGETAWQNPKTTQELIDVVKAAGFNAVRIPCNWYNGYIENTETCKIKDSWLQRVKEVVDYCVGRDMYAIINIHYDGGWLELSPTYDKQVEVNRIQSLLWSQIATYFRDYDEHLLFSGTNEVRIKDVYDNSKVTAENIEVQESYNQTFVNAVRLTGGRNAYRNLIIQSYNTNIDLALTKFTPAVDVVSDRLMLEVHTYDPWDYAGDTKLKYWGKPYKEFGIANYCQEDYFDTLFANLKAKFIDKGLPIILGEYGCNRHSSVNTNMINSRAYYLEYVTRAAKKVGIAPFVWDNGYLNDGQDQFGMIDRRNLSVYDQPAIDGLMRGAKE